MLKLQMVMEKNAANDLEDGILLQMEKKNTHYVNLGSENYILVISK